MINKQSIIISFQSFTSSFTVGYFIVYTGHLHVDLIHLQSSLQEKHVLHTKFIH